VSAGTFCGSGPRTPRLGPALTPRSTPRDTPRSTAGTFTEEGGAHGLHSYLHSISLIAMELYAHSWMLVSILVALPLLVSGRPRRGLQAVGSTGAAETYRGGSLSSASWPTSTLRSASPYGYLPSPMNLISSPPRGRVTISHELCCVSFPLDAVSGRVTSSARPFSSRRTPRDRAMRPDGRAGTPRYS
jgi:hypothetical protein